MRVYNLNKFINSEIGYLQGMLVCTFLKCVIGCYDVPETKRVVGRSRDDEFSVRGKSDRVHPTCVPLRIELPLRELNDSGKQAHATKKGGSEIRAQIPERLSAQQERERVIRKSSEDRNKEEDEARHAEPVIRQT